MCEGVIHLHEQVEEAFRVLATNLSDGRAASDVDWSQLKKLLQSTGEKLSDEVMRPYLFNRHVLTLSPSIGLEGLSQGSDWS